MTKQNIILTGFMGTGKSTVGKMLAKKLGYSFIDTDETIMSRCGITIAEIFKSQGEAAFRKMERSLALELSNQEGLVISTGGGMLLDSVNAELLEGTIESEMEGFKTDNLTNNKEPINSNHRGTAKTKGKIFCLVASTDEIIARISSDTNIERPLLKVDDTKIRVTQLIQERKEQYARFIEVDTTTKTPEVVCNTIIKLFQNSED